MALSNSFDWVLTRDQVIAAALRLCGSLGDYETANANQIANAAVFLNAIIKNYMNRGMPVWKTGIINIPLSNYGSGNSITIGPGGTITSIPKPMAIYRIDITYNPADGGYRELTPYDRNTFFMTDLAGVSGVPNSWFYVPERTTGLLYLHQKPSTEWQATGSIRVQYQAQQDDVDSGSDDIDFPAEWHLVIVYELASHLAPIYGVAGADLSNIKQTLKSLKTDADGFDTEMGSIYIRP